MVENPPRPSIRNRLLAWDPLPWLAILTLAALALRLYRLDFKSIWVDEAFSIYVSQRPLGQIPSLIRGDVHPPLYYFVLNLFLPFGSSEFVARLPSALFGAAAVPLAFLAGRELLGRREGLLGALLLTVSVMHVYFSQEARMYPLFTFFALLSVLLFLRARKSGRFLDWLLYVPATVLGLYTHFFMVVLVGVQALYLVAESLLRRKARDRARSLPPAIALGAVAALFLPQAVALWEALTVKASSLRWGFAPTADLVPRILLQFSGPELVVGVALNLLFAAGLASLLRQWRRNLFLLLWILVPLLGSYGFASLLSFRERYIIFALPAYFLAVAKGVLVLSGFIQRALERRSEGARKDSGARGRAVFVAVLLLALATSVSALADLYSRPAENEDWRRIATLLADLTQPGDAVVPVPGYMWLPLAYYYNNTTDGTVLVQTDDTAAPGPPPPTRDLFPSLPRGNLSLREFAFQPRTVWFVVSKDILLLDREGATLAWLDNNTQMRVDGSPLYRIYTRQNTDWKEVADFLAPRVQRGDALAVVPGGASDLLAAGYSPEARGVRTLDVSPSSLPAALSGERRVWVVATWDLLREAPVTLAWLKANFATVERPGNAVVFFRP